MSGRVAPEPHPTAVARVHPSLRVGAVDDPAEREADAVADRVMRMTTSSAAAAEVPDATVMATEPTLRRACGCGCGGDNDEVRRTASDGDIVRREGAEEEDELQMKPAGSAGDMVRREGVEEEDELQMKPAGLARGGVPVGAEVGARISARRGGGSGLSPDARSFFEPRFGADLSGVRIHRGEEPASLAASVSARAFTVGQDVFFGAGEGSFGTAEGRRLMAHELTHTLQARVSPWRGRGRDRRAPGGSSCSTMRRQVDASTASRAGPRLEHRPSRNGAPCGCLVFIHNNERNARTAVEGLHRVCRYNLAIVPDDGGRRIPHPSGRGTIDPNELFDPRVQAECVADRTACERRAAAGSDLRSLQERFILALTECNENFTLPTIALHNNAIGDTTRIRSGFHHNHLAAALVDTYVSEPEGDELGRDDLRRRLGAATASGRRLLTTPRTTNIFRWCNLPEIERCHVGDPWRPDHVVWVVRRGDFDRLVANRTNVVLQGDGASDAGSESATDLSTAAMRASATARFVNIETPGSPRDDETRLDNMRFVLSSLSAVGLECCDVSDGAGSDGTAGNGE